jgi:chemosensory pili system protein ChpA (sensor histidine kinase/response regulator)
MHQAYGALAIVGLDGITEFADAIEKLLAALGDGNARCDGGHCGGARRIYALRGYLDDLVAGHPDQPLKLFGVPTAPWRWRADSRHPVRPTCSSPI